MPQVLESRPIYDLICVHPNALKDVPIYRFVVVCGNNETKTRFNALVIVANPCLAAINTAIHASLGDRWFATKWEVAV